MRFGLLCIGVTRGPTLSSHLSLGTSSATAWLRFWFWLVSGLDSNNLQKKKEIQPCTFFSFFLIPMIRICFSCFRCNDDAIQGAVLLADGPFPDASHDPWLGLLNFLFPGPLLHYRATRRLGPVQLERYFAALLQKIFEESKVERGEWTTNSYVWVP